MMIFGKSCRYELHPPMSLSDMLAALFRGKPKNAGAGTFLTREQSPERNGPETALLRALEDREPEGAGALQLK
jgi:hypothetical protein